MTLLPSRNMALSAGTCCQSHNTCAALHCLQAAGEVAALQQQLSEQKATSADSARQLSAARTAVRAAQEALQVWVLVVVRLQPRLSVCCPECLSMPPALLWLRLPRLVLLTPHQDEQRRSQQAAAALDELRAQLEHAQR